MAANRSTSERIEQTLERLGTEDHVWVATSSADGVPHLVPHAETIEEMLAAVESAMMAAGTIQQGQQVVLICGFPVGAIRPTNLALLHTVGE